MMRVLYLLMFCIFFPGVAMSAQKCINFGDLSGFLDSYVADLGDVDWLLAWPHITIRGILFTYPSTICNSPILSAAYHCGKKL